MSINNALFFPHDLIQFLNMRSTHPQFLLHFKLYFLDFLASFPIANIILRFL